MLLESLDPHNSQLFRYFHTTSTKFGLPSNGIIYRFYTVECKCGWQRFYYSIQDDKDEADPAGR